MDRRTVEGVQTAREDRGPLISLTLAGNEALSILAGQRRGTNANEIESARSGAGGAK